MTNTMINVASCMTAIGGIDTGFNDGHKVLPNSGLYVRYLKFKAGDMVIGKEHTEWSANILAYGDMIIMDSPYGNKLRISGPKIFESSPGSQKIGKALTDCLFINVYKAEKDETEDEVVKRVINIEEVV